MQSSDTAYWPLSEAHLSSVEPAPSAPTRDFFGIAGDGNASISPYLMLPNLKHDVQSVIERYSLWPAVFVGQRMMQELRQTMMATMDLKVESDPEAPDREELVIVYAISNKTYDEILGIWDDVSDKVHQALPTTCTGRVYVRLVRV
jgi:hypothetical protein